METSQVADQLELVILGGNHQKPGTSGFKKLETMSYSTKKQTFLILSRLYYTVVLIAPNLCSSIDSSLSSNNFFLIVPSHVK